MEQHEASFLSKLLVIKSLWLSLTFKGSLTPQGVVLYVEPTLLYSKQQIEEPSRTLDETFFFVPSVI